MMSNYLSPEMVTAGVRGVLGGLVTFGIVTLTTAQASVGWEPSIIAGGIAGLSYLGLRLGIEGPYDARQRARE